MSKTGTPVFTDESGRRTVAMQLVARAVVALFVLTCGALALSLVVGVPLPGLDRLVPGQRQQEHQATRDAPVTGLRTGAHQQRVTGSSGGNLAEASGPQVADLPGSAVSGRTSTGATTSSTHSPTATGSNASGAHRSSSGQPAAQPTSGPTTGGGPSATPSSSQGQGAQPTAKPRNPKAATPTKGSSAFSNSHAHRASATATAVPSTPPGKSGVSQGKPGAGASG
jgi:hypothetical protein